jgi:hypothetical protein
MGIPLDIFSLHLLQGVDAGCRHYLLLRVGRRSFNNADEGDYARAVGAADATRDALIETFGREVLAAVCSARHAVSLAGELQSSPAGDELSEGPGGVYVELWVAETRFGHPWVVLGTAGDEEEFWRRVAMDEDLLSLGPYAPARKRRAYFLGDNVNNVRAGFEG